MKKILFENRFLLWLLVAMWLITLLSSCKNRQRISERVQTETFKEKDELFFLKNLRVADTFVLSVPSPETYDKKCDSACQKEIQRLLKLLNTKKKSGNNEYGFYYDEYKKTLTAYANLDSTFSAYKNKETEKTTKDYHFEIIKVPRKYVPLWVKILAWIGAISIVYIVVKNYSVIKKIFIK